LLKGNRRSHKQINRGNPLHLIAKESLPGLQRSIPPRHHVDRNRGLGDLDAQFEQLAIDLCGAPQGVLEAHSSDQVAHLLADPRPTSARTRLPSPVSSKALSMPAHNGLGPDNGNGIKNARTATIEPDEQGAVDPAQMWSKWSAPLQDVELVPQQVSASNRRCDLNQSHSMRTNRRPIAIIRRSWCDSVLTASQWTEFSEATPGEIARKDVL